MFRLTGRALYWLLINILALWVAVIAIPGISIVHTQDIVAVGFVLALVNSWVGPILRLVTCPVRLLTFGLFSLVVDWLLFVLAAWIGKKMGASITITGFLPALGGALIVALVTSLGNRVNPFTGKKHSH